MQAPFPLDDEPSLVRLEIVGLLARAARLCLQECEPADTVEIALVAAPEGFRVDVQQLAAGQAIAGWGQ